MVLRGRDVRVVARATTLLPLLVASRRHRGVRAKTPALFRAADVRTPLVAVGRRTAGRRRGCCHQNGRCSEGERNVLAMLAALTTVGRVQGQVPGFGF